ncbi:helix-turn-helix transcriptional regulator [Sphingobium sp. TomTYG45]
MTLGYGLGRFEIASATHVAEGILVALAKSASPPELAALMADITRELGFRHYALIHHVDLRGSPPNRVRLLDYPINVEERIIEQANWRRDPVIRACAFTHRAFNWSELPYIIRLDRRDRECLDLGGKSGLNEGITVPCHLLGDNTASCTFAGSMTPKWAGRQLGMAQMIGIFAFQAARRLFCRERPKPQQPRLHPRVRDCVILVGRGYSNKQIARALSITPRTVGGYLTQAGLLLDAHGRTELVVSAIFAGEIGLGELARDHLA